MPSCHSKPFIWGHLLRTCTGNFITRLNISRIFYMPDFQSYTFSQSAYTELFKSISPTSSFTCPGPSGNGICRALCYDNCPRGTVITWGSFIMYLKVHINATCIYVTQPQWVNSLWPSDAIWRQRSGSTLAQVMACCLSAASHYLNQCWLFISMVQWHSYEGSFTRDASAIDH